MSSTALTTINTDATAARSDGGPDSPLRGSQQKQPKSARPSGGSSSRGGRGSRRGGHPKSERPKTQAQGSKETSSSKDPGTRAQSDNLDEKLGTPPSPQNQTPVTDPQTPIRDESGPASSVNSAPPTKDTRADTSSTASRRPKSTKEDRSQSKHEQASYASKVLGNSNMIKPRAPVNDPSPAVTPPAQGATEGSVSSDAEQPPVIAPPVPQIGEQADISLQGKSDEETEARTKEREAWMQEREAWMRERETLMKEKKTSEEKVSLAEKRVNGYAKAVNRSQLRITELEALQDKALQQAGTKSLALEAELKALQTRYDNAQQLLSIRGEELKIVQEFAPKPDGYSTADILSTVQALNDEIFQAAAFITDLMLPGEMYFGYPARILPGDIIHLFLGDRLFMYLASTGPGQRRADLVTCVIQAALVSASKHISSSWSSHRELNIGLTRIYEEMKKAEPQSVVSKWRVLCKTYERISPEDELARVRSFFITLILDAFRALGYPGHVDMLRGTVEADIEDFHSRINALAERSTKLRHAIGREVLSSEFSTVEVAPGTYFNPSSMEDGGDGGDVISLLGAGSTVLCTTELGLKTERKEGGVWKETILQKPKVIMATMLPTEF